MQLTIRHLVCVSFVAALGWILGAAAPAHGQDGPPADPPNILWLSAEDLSPRLGAYGDPVAQTPHLDRLAEQGVRYTHAFTTAGVCAPSRAAIITGMYQNGIGAQHMRTTRQGPGLPTPYHAVPPPYVKAFPEYLRAAGYFATNNRKTDYQIGEPSTVWDASSGEAHWRDRPDADPPFFAVFNFGVTHESQLFGDDENTTTDPAEVEVPPYYPDTPDVRQEIARHYDNIARLDEQVGEMLDQLADDGLADETIVVFWGDHGDGLPRAKRWLYDSGIRVPLIVHVPEAYRAWAGIGAPGSTNDELVSLMDLGPTMLSLAGADIPQHMNGRAFLGPKASPAPEYVFGARDRIDTVYDMVRSARGPRYHYIRNGYPRQPYVQTVAYRNQVDVMQELLRLHAAGALEGAETLWMRDRRPPEELYDTEADPHEVNNLADDPNYQDVLQRMRRATDAWMESIDDLGTVSEVEMVRRMWPNLQQPQTHAPLILPRRTTDLDGWREPLDGPTEVIIYSPTQNASIEYKTTPDGRWQLYTGPLHLAETTTIQARAIRYGYEHSEVTTATFTFP